MIKLIFVFRICACCTTKICTCELRFVGMALFDRIEIKYLCDVGASKTISRVTYEKIAEKRTSCGLFEIDIRKRGVEHTMRDSNQSG